MYKVEPSSPKQTLAVFVPVSMLPSTSPLGENTQTPPGPVAQRLPSLSIFMPSGKPGRLSLTHFMPSTNSLPSPMAPSELTGNDSQIGASKSELATYSVFSSGDSAMPLGRDISLVRSTSSPPRRRRKTPK